MDINKAFSVNDGIIIDEDNGGPFYTGGTASPIGLGLPANTFYTQTVASGVLIWQKYGAGDTASDWRNYPASGISFDNTGIKYNATTVQGAVKEVRDNTVLAIDTLTSSLNGNHTILVSDSNIHVVSGTATGYSVTLPDATALFDGRRFEIINDTPENVLVKDNGGNLLATLIQDDNITATLESNATVNGSWLTTVVTSSSTGITSYVITSDTLFSTSSTSDVIITGFTVTPLSGRYSLFYSADIEISKNNKLADCVAFVGGSAIENTRKQAQGASSNFKASQQTIGEITVNGSQAVDIRVKISRGSLDVNQRSLVLIRLGS